MLDEFKRKDWKEETNNIAQDRVNLTIPNFSAPKTRPLAAQAKQLLHLSCIYNILYIQDKSRHEAEWRDFKNLFI